MEAPISASQGVMRSLPGMLELLLSDPGNKLQPLKKGEKNKIRTLKRDLEELMKYLVEPSEVETPALTASSWMKEVRELSYDIHDFVDELVNVDFHAENQQAPRSKTSPFQEKFIERYKNIDDEVSRFGTRVKEAIQLHKDHLGSMRKWPSSSAASLDEERPPRHEGGLPLVGMASSIDKISGWLANDGKPEHKVACIVGVGGAGKTTLAKQLYSNLAGEFQCRAFVRTSRKPDPRRLLNSILTQVRRHQPLGALEAPNLVNEIKEYLKDKTYFIIFDDVWDPSTWDIVNRSLPRGGYCSRILTTTEVEVVARICCAGNSNYIFKKQLLSDNEPRKLYSNIVSSHQSDQCPKDHNEVPDEIINAMGGLPLAIVIMASTLAHQPDKKEYIKSYPSSPLMGVANLDGIKQVLNFSYNSLPQYLKACMLYLSLYEEDSIIWKDDLVKQWISEGFICAVERKDEEKVAQRYFDELIDRGIIQPEDFRSNDEVLSCTVHYMVLDLIRDKSIEENFIIAIDHSQTAAARLADKVRRLALHFGYAGDAKPPSMRLSQVRSLSFSGLFKCMPSIVEFRFLRVLILKLLVDPDDTSKCNLTGISGLFRLRYLHIDACHMTVELPIQIKGLKDLVALEIEANLTAVPSDIVDIPGLLYLSLPSEAHLPSGIGRMTSVRTLRYFNLSSNSEDNVLDLGKMTNLQDLRLTCSTVETDNLKNKMQLLESILSTLSKLESVALVNSRSSNVNTLNDVGVSSTTVSPPALLQRLEMSRRCCIFYSLPRWIGKLSKLCILKLAVRGLTSSDFDIIKGLPALTALSLYIHTLPEERIVFTKDGFSVLKHLKFRASVLWVKFEEDATPNLQKLKLCFKAPRLDENSTTSISIGHLSSLEEISVKIGSTGVGADTESTMKTAIISDSRNPRIKPQVVDCILYSDASVKIERNKNRTKDQDKLEDEKTQGTSRISSLPESSINLTVPELMERMPSTVEDAMVSGPSGVKSSTLIVKVDLECETCYKKIRKVLIKIQGKENIRAICFDSQRNHVIISGPFDPEKLCNRLCRKAGRVIKEMQVVQPKREEHTKPSDILIDVPEANTRRLTRTRRFKKTITDELVDYMEISRPKFPNTTEQSDEDPQIEIVAETSTPEQTRQPDSPIEEIVESNSGKEQTMQPDVLNYHVETVRQRTQGQSKLPEEAKAMVPTIRRRTADERFKEVCPVCNLWPCSDPISHRSLRKQNRGGYRSLHLQRCSQHQHSAWMSCGGRQAIM